MLRGLTTVSLFADDIPAAREWYSALLGITPYFERPDSENPAYIEYRIGDYQHELGIIDRRYAPHGAADGPSGAVVFWHVDDVTAAVEKLLSMGATEHEHAPNASRDSSPRPSWTRSATSSASCTTRITWTFWVRAAKRELPIFILGW